MTPTGFIPWPQRPELPPDAYGDWAAFSATVRSLHERRWNSFEELDCKDGIISGIVPASLQQKAKAVAFDSQIVWCWSLWRHCRYRHPAIGSAADLHAWIDFLRWCCTHLACEETVYFWADPFQPRHVVGCTVERCPTTNELLDFAAPLFRGAWPPDDRGDWLERLERLKLREERCCLPDRHFLDLPRAVWDVMRRIPGEDRPLEPLQVNPDIVRQSRSLTLYDVNRAFDIAVRWCEKQQKRDRKAAMPALERRAIGRPPVPETSPPSGAAQLSSTALAGASDDTAFRPAKEFLDTENGPRTYNELHRILDVHPEIRKQKPSPQRLRIHAGDWQSFRQSQFAADPLDLPAQIVDAAVAEVQARQAEVRQSKSGK